MLATLNSKQIVDEIVKDTAKDGLKDAVKDAVKDNDPHDTFKISPDIVLASRIDREAAPLAPDLTVRAEPKIAEPKIPQPKIAQPNISAMPAAPAAAPSVDTAVREAANDLRAPRKRSRIGRWLAGASLSMLFAAGSAAATIAWQVHGESAKEIIAAWVPTLTASQATPAANQQAAAPETQPTAADQPAAAPSEQPQDTAAAAPAAAASDTSQSMQSMTRDLAAMGAQIEQLKATIAELKAGQEQMAREMTKAQAPKPAEAKIVDPRTKLSALPPKPAAVVPPPVRKPKPVTTPAYAPSYAPMPIAPPPPQSAAVPPPPGPQAVADDDGPVVRPPMPLR
jgi:hypothetical protein